MVASGPFPAVSSFLAPEMYLSEGDRTCIFYHMPCSISMKFVNILSSFSLRKLLLPFFITFPTLMCPNFKLYRQQYFSFFYELAYSL